MPMIISEQDINKLHYLVKTVKGIRDCSIYITKCKMSQIYTSHGDQYIKPIQYDDKSYISLTIISLKLNNEMKQINNYIHWTTDFGEEKYIAYDLPTVVKIVKNYFFKNYYQCNNNIIMTYRKIINDIKTKL